MRKKWRPRQRRNRPRLTLRIVLSSHAPRKGIMNPLPRIQTRKYLKQPSSVCKSRQFSSALLNGSKWAKRKEKNSAQLIPPMQDRIICFVLFSGFSSHFILCSSLLSSLPGAEVDAYPFRLPMFMFLLALPVSRLDCTIFFPLLIDLVFIQKKNFLSIQV